MSTSCKVLGNAMMEEWNWFEGQRKVVRLMSCLSYQLLRPCKIISMVKIKILWSRAGRYTDFKMVYYFIKYHGINNYCGI